MNKLKRDEKKIKNISKRIVKECGYITCLHNINNTCSQSKCEIFERTLLQEY